MPINRVNFAELLLNGADFGGSGGRPPIDLTFEGGRHGTYPHVYQADFIAFSLERAVSRGELTLAEGQTVPDFMESFYRSLGSEAAGIGSRSVWQNMFDNVSGTHSRCPDYFNEMISELAFWDLKAKVPKVWQIKNQYFLQRCISLQHNQQLVALPSYN